MRRPVEELCYTPKRYSLPIVIPQARSACGVPAKRVVYFHCDGASHAAGTVDPDTRFARAG
jgi:hypothetical protein